MDQLPCSACGAPLAADQRYCLECGERCGRSRLDPLALASGPRADDTDDSAVSPRRGLPAPRWMAVAGLATLVAGAALGAAAGPGTTASALAAAAASAEPVIVALAPVAAQAPAAEPEPDPESPVEPPVDTEPPLEREPAITEPPPAPAEEPAAPADPEPEEPGTPKVPPIKHVWLLMLTGHGFADAFGPAPEAVPASPYLARELPTLGALLPLYYAIARGPLPNGIALLSGRGPNPDTLAGCPVFAECIHPADVSTLGDQLTGAGLTWRAYVEATGDVPPGTPVPCDQPNPRNPFVYFHSIVDTPECGSNVVGLDRLAPDLAAPDQTPAFSYVVPSACHDGAEAPCAEGAPAGLAATEPWLRDVVAQITATKAYQDGGLVVITFDHEPAAPGATPTDEIHVPLLKRGGSVGALLLSPYVEPGTTVLVTTGHVSLLRTLEDVFGVPHLGRAADPEVHPWGPGVFKRWSPNVHDNTTNR